MHIAFLGAARSVTGSKHLLSVNGQFILLDCGLVQGHRQEADHQNRNLPFDPASIDCVILSHAHIDHSGNLPRLVAQGFSGPIYCTPATRDLCSIMLPDSAHIQEKDVEYVNKRHKRKGLPPVRPLYTLEEAIAVPGRMVSLSYGRPMTVVPGVKLHFVDAGHILGSAITLLDISENGRSVRLAYTGDLGRPNMPLLRDPQQIRDVDALITESTYGNRLHKKLAEIPQRLADIVNRTYERKGKIIVPAFSVERTQEVVYFLNQLWRERKIPDLPVFVDSPLSTNATAIFRMHPECFDLETYQFMQEHEDPFGFDRLHYVRDVQESKRLNTLNEPCIIISASGMCESGRILHHLKNNIENPANTILIVGYMAENTLGRRLVERHEWVNIFGEPYRLHAEVAVLNAFSAHADRQELLAYLRGMNVERLKHVFVVHGEPSQAEPLAEALRTMVQCEVRIPELGEAVDI
ncbi:MAG: MBL fold metallo-hydrolase [bacterium]|nr:MBL fold metallo-hydrolase [candidate division KSB1 bacterium]MDH7561684.1 MBL fold metallo-hydrolase [bacterium]